MHQPVHLCILAAPKPFRGHTGIIQRNAIRSWRALGRDVEIVLAGDVEGLASIAEEVKAVLPGPIASGVDGPPRVDDLFSRGRAVSTADTLAYINSDIILMPDWLEAVRRTATAMRGDFLIVGRRIDVDIDDEIDWRQPDQSLRLTAFARSCGRLAARVCKDYFVFPKDSYQHVPAFTLGRAFWDNWMVYNAHSRGIPVVDITANATAVHQNHDYAHVPGGRLAAYLTSQGALANRRLAGGSRMISGAVASWQLRCDGTLRRRRTPAMISFMLDLHRFVGLTTDVVGLTARRRRHDEAISLGAHP